ncbi:hypothetical protein KVT40_005588 [Elsinoe batatas]|uniref:Rhodopsin domain-containing protein n=1 Tax=Elsinoe batatas TaxID=2601811 RepID=A0A8K0L1U9_9PEZI|nr:hypothetical protein KVT40_005588 [Elsinoe batatas]
MLSSVGRDDYIMFATQIIFTLHEIFQTLDIWYGNGRHIEYLTQGNAELSLKYWYICGVFYITGTSILKVAIGVFLLRFVTTRLQTWTVYLLNSAAIVFGIAYLVFYLALCRPISYWWNLDSDAPGYCISADVFLNVGYAAAGLNALADGAFAALPAVIVWRTSMDRRTRIVVCCLLGFGSLACIGTIIRIGFGSSFKGYKGDFLYATTPIAVLSTLELGFGIVTANVATLRPLFQRFFPSSFVGSDQKRTATFDLEETGDEGKLRVVKRTSARKSRPGQNIRSLTGRESIGNMPDLMLVREIKEEDLLGTIQGLEGDGRNNSATEPPRSNSASFMARIPPVSRLSLQWPLRQDSEADR